MLYISAYTYTYYIHINIDTRRWPWKNAILNVIAGILPDILIYWKQNTEENQVHKISDPKM